MNQITPEDADSRDSNNNRFPLEPNPGALSSFSFSFSDPSQDTGTEQSDPEQVPLASLEGLTFNESNIVNGKYSDVTPAISSTDPEERLTRWMDKSKDILDELSIMARSWGREFQELGWDDFAWCLGGAMKCGHFMGPKPSRNPDLGEEQSVVEVDYRLMLPDHIDPLSPEVKEQITRVTGFAWKKDYDERRWHPDKESPQSIFYGYVPMASNDGRLVEVELSVQRNSQWVEVSNYWQEVFSPEEIKWQAFCRDYLRQEGHSYTESVKPLKKWQCDEARWRILAGFASGRFSEQPPKMIEDLVQNWTGRKIPDEVVAALPLSAELKIQPAAPHWVQQAKEEYTALKREKEGQ